MVTDFSRHYQPPGVYIDENESVAVVSAGVPPTVVAICGPGAGHQVHVDQVALGSTAVELSKQGIDTSSVEVRAVATNAVVDPTHYTLTTVNQNPDVTQDFYVTIADTGTNPLDDGTMVFVSYNYTPADYYQPKRMDNFEAVKDVYGEPLNLTTGSTSDPDYQFVLSPLSLAAKVAMENGATEVILCAATLPDAGGTDSEKSDARRTALAAAYAKVAALPSVNVLVGVTAGIATADAGGALTDLSQHLNNASGDGYHQFGIIGFDPEVATAPGTLLTTAGVENRRLMLAYVGPGALTMYSSGVGAPFAASHTYLAAAYAGRMAGLPIQRSLTKQSISSFSGINGSPLTNSLRDQYSQGGVAVAEVDHLGRLVVRHGVTTDPTSVNTREASVVRARDGLVTMIRNGFSDSDLIGQAIDEDILFTVKSSMQGFMEEALDSDLIVAYNNLAVRQQTVDPSVIEVKFDYKPAYPLNYIAVSFSIDMTTAAVEDLAIAEEAVA